MKRNALAAVLSVMALLLSCSKQQQDNLQESMTGDVLHISLAYLNSDTKPTKFSPILAFECDGKSIVQFFNPSSPNVNVFLYEEDKNRAVMLASDKNIVLAPLSGNEDIFIFNADVGLNTVFYGTFHDSVFELMGEIPLDMEEVPTKASSYNYGDEYRFIIKHGVFDKLASEGGRYGDALNMATLGECHAGDLFKNLSRLYAALGSVVLADGAGTDFQEEVINSVEAQFTDIIKGMAQSAVLKLVPSGLRTIAGWAVKICEGAFSSEEDVSVSEEDTAQAQKDYIEPVFSRMKSLKPLEEWVVQPQDRNPFSLSVSVSDIGKTSATFSGSSDYKSDGYTHAYDAVLEQGYMYAKASDGEKHYVVSEGMSPKVITLEPGTQYYAFAWVHTLSGKDWLSERANSFYTRGTRLSFSPFSALGFNHDGGSEITNVVVSDGGTWRIVESPSWCKVSTTPTSITVAVPSTKSDREGYIQVETTSVYGETESSNIYVSQKEINRDNYICSLSGTASCDLRTYSWTSSHNGIWENETTKHEENNVIATIAMLDGDYYLDDNLNCYFAFDCWKVGPIAPNQEKAIVLVPLSERNFSCEVCDDSIIIRGSFINKVIDSSTTTDTQIDFIYTISGIKEVNPRIEYEFDYSECVEGEFGEQKWKNIRYRKGKGQMTTEEIMLLPKGITIDDISGELI